MFSIRSQWHGQEDEPRTLLDKVRAMLLDARLPESYCYDALEYAALLNDVVPTHALGYAITGHAAACPKHTRHIKLPHPPPDPSFPRDCNINLTTLRQASALHHLART